MDKPTKHVLSASKIETYQKCSLVYYAKYLNKTPDKENYGALRGTICHDIFEMLIEEKYKDRVDEILEEGSILKDKKLIDLINSMMSGFNMEELDDKGQNNFEMICEMIFVGLNYDFYCKGYKVDYENLETMFYLKGTEDQPYELRGKIDKPSSRGKKYRIVDYKSSAQKKQDVELEFSVQALSYILWAKKAKDMTAFVEFVFLRFPDKPDQRVEVTDEVLEGFESWLSDLYVYLKNFDELNMYDNMAADKGYPKDGTFSGSIVCGYGKYPGHSYSDTHKNVEKRGKPYYVCSEKWPYDYWILKDEDGNIVKSTRDEEDFKDKDQSLVEKKSWQGCPKFTNSVDFLEWKGSK